MQLGSYAQKREHRGAALVAAHHFAKGDSTAKSAIDRMSGAGAWARDPDSIMVMTPHEEADCFSVNMTLRNLPRKEDLVVRWEYPLMRLAPDLNPDALRRLQSKNKVCTDNEFREAVLNSKGKSFTNITADAKAVLDMSPRTAATYLKRLVEKGLVRFAGGLYWVEGA